MPPVADLRPSSASGVKVAFATGPAALNREMLERFAAMEPDVPLYVVAEFEPHLGQWIPWHVLRGLGENLAAVRAAIGSKPILKAAMVLAPGTSYGKLRLLALMLAPAVLIAWDEELRLVSPAGFGRHLLRRATSTAQKQLQEGGRMRKWLRRLLHPREAEIPVRARKAQVYGAIASRLHGVLRDEPMPDQGPLMSGVSVVVPSRDGCALLRTMLPALAPQIVQGEIIVSDNGSSDGTAAWLAQHYPAVRVIVSKTPLSFACAVNAGIAAAKFSRTLLLNNDMIAAPGFMASLESAFARVPDLFCATAQIFFPPGVRRQETGKAVWRRENPEDFPVRCDDPVEGEDLTWVLYGSGGCSLFDTAKLRSLGGVSEVFVPAYVEDLDLGYRAWKQGWPSVFCASAQVEHRHRATTSRYFTPQQLDVFVECNYLRFLIHAIASPALFRRLWSEAVRRLQLKAMAGNTAALEALRGVPVIGQRPPVPAGALSEPEILALGAGDVAVFPGRLAREGTTILVASPYLPFPLSHGGAVRIYNLMKGAATEYAQVLIAFCDELAAPPPELLDICCEVVLVRRRGSHYRKDTTKPDAVEEFDSLAFRACLKQTVLRWKPAIAQLEFTQMAQYVADCAPAKTILVEHDITFDLQEQLLATSPETGVARWELEKQLARWREFETQAWQQVDCVVTMSGKDARTAAGARLTACLPNGVDTQRFQPDNTAQPEARRLLFIGSFAHLPNLLALDFFLRDVWPLLGPGFTLHVIAGARDEYFLDFYRNRVSPDLGIPGVEVEGFVSDVRDAYRRAELVLAPLTASAGTNIKVLEAMAMGRVVVSTPAGINGLDLTPGQDIIITTTAETMASEIGALCGDRQRRAGIEAAARRTALQYDWSAIALEQTKLYRRLAGTPIS